MNCSVGRRTCANERKKNTRQTQTYLINAMVGRVAPRAPSRELDKGSPALKVGRLGARGAARPTMYEMATRRVVTPSRGAR